MNCILPLPCSPDGTCIPKYNLVQPEDAVAIPTGFKLNNNPLITLDGKIKEIGKMEKFHDAKLDISANQYAEKVDFVQVVKCGEGRFCASRQVKEQCENKHYGKRRIPDV